MIAGGWTRFRTVTEEDQNLFREALKEFCGTGFEPLIVATQVVAGVKHRFICNARSAIKPSRDYLAEVIIVAPLEGKPTVIHIEEIS